jgi:fatty acid desaturase
MAEAAREDRPAAEPAPFDPHAVQRAYRLERARRRARDERTRARRLAAVRFAVFLLALLALSVFLGLTVWEEIQRLFGL